ncbi:MAG: hypothetical protein UIM53_03220 [Acutalibacteraceae bacterium]|nr:hypothetical protein [Acutalibacteraceae bacterium]
MLTEKAEKLIRTGLLCFLFILLILVFFMLNQHSQYSNTEKMIEQGEMPGYVLPVDERGQSVSNGQSETVIEETQPKQIVKSEYYTMTYSAMLKACEKKKDEKIRLTATVYSALQTSSSIIYDVADDMGNYYSIVGKVDDIKFKTSDKIVIYGTPRGTTNLNSAAIPQLSADLIEIFE